jgi:aspartate racemase
VRRIGLIGGTSWESTAHYYTQLNQGVRERLGGFHSADLVLRSVDFAEVEALQTAGDWATLARRYGEEARLLRTAGAELIGVLANTMHLVADDVAAGSGLPVVHIVDAVADALAGAGHDRVALLGTRFTMDSAALYPRRLAARGITTLVPEPADAAEVHRVIYAELVHGRVLDPSRRACQEIIGRLVDAGAQAVVLGCTELSMLLDPADPAAAAVPLLDSTALHVTALLDAALAPSAAAHQTLSPEEGAA